MHLMAIVLTIMASSVLAATIGQVPGFALGLMCSVVIGLLVDESRRKHARWKAEGR